MFLIHLQIIYLNINSYLSISDMYRSLPVLIFLIVQVHLKIGKITIMIMYRDCFLKDCDMKFW